MEGDKDFTRIKKVTDLVVGDEAKRGVTLRITSLGQVRDAAISWIEHYQSLKPVEKKSYLVEIRKQRSR